MKTNLEIIRATYEGSSEDNGKHLMDALRPDSIWIEAAGFPYGGTYVGAEDIVANVFTRLATEWEGYRADVHTYMADGDRVAAFGVYSGVYRKTGLAMGATFAHLYLLKDGKIVSMEQYVDSAKVRQAMVADSESLLP